MCDKKTMVTRRIILLTVMVVLMAVAIGYGEEGAARPSQPHRHSRLNRRRKKVMPPSVLPPTAKSSQSASKRMLI